MERLTARDQVAQEIRRRIWSGELKSGDRIGQEELAESLGVSRIPIREALISLTHEGAVRSVPHLGSSVEPLTEQGVVDHYALYGVVDGFALERAIQRASDEELTALAEAMTAVAGIGDPSALEQAVADIRDEVHRLGGSARFHAVVRGLYPMVVGNFFEVIDGASAMICSGMPEVGARVAAKDVAGAVDRYEAMAIGNGTLVVADMRRRGIID